MTTDELRDTLVTIIMCHAGGTRERWTELIGPVEPLPIWFNPRSNWRITPVATGEELQTIREAAKLVREEFPYVRK